MAGRMRLPRTKQSLIKHYKRKGFRHNPLLTGSKGEDLRFTKPLPNRRQVHVRIWLKGRKNVKIEKHVDRKDPYQNPLGHFIKDVANPVHVPHKTRYFPKKRRIRSETKRKRSRKRRL